MILLAGFLVAVFLTASFTLIVQSKKRAWLKLLPVMVVAIASASVAALRLEVVPGSKPEGEVRIYFSISDPVIFDRVTRCISNPTSTCPPELTSAQNQVVAVVSRNALDAVRRSRWSASFTSVRPLRVPEQDGGLSLEDGLAEMLEETTEKQDTDAKYVFVTPRVRSMTDATSSFEQMVNLVPTLARNIVFLDIEALGLEYGSVIPALAIEAPSVVSADADEYELRITSSNRTHGTIAIDASQLISSVGAVDERKVQNSQGALSLASVGDEPGSFLVPIDRQFVTEGLIKTTANSVTLTHAVARNQFGESLAQASAITRVEKPILGFLRFDVSKPNDFQRFANASGIETESVTLEFASLGDAENRDRYLEDAALTLSDWGMLVVAEPMSAAHAELLIEIFERTPQGQSPPSLLFAGGGDSSFLASDFNSEQMAGWKKFLEPLGLGGISGTRKIYLAVDQSGSLAPYRKAVKEAVETLFDAETGFGARDANLLVAFCGQPRQDDCKTELVNQVDTGDLRGTDWEGAHHLRHLNNYAQAEAGRYFSQVGALRTVSDIVLFWDGTDLWEARTRAAARRMPEPSVRALESLESSGVGVHVATFANSLAADSGVKRLEKLSGFGSSASATDFRNTIVKAVIDRGLTVKQGDIGNLSEITSRQIASLDAKNIQVINSLFAPNSLQAVRNSGAIVPLLARHPSGFDAPLLAIRDSVPFSIGEQQINLRVGYLGLDLTSEFAAINMDGEIERRHAVSGVVFAAIDAMGARLKAPSLSWNFFGNEQIVVQRSDFLPFQLAEPLEAAVSELDRTGLVSGVASQRLVWDEVSLERVGVNLSGVRMTPGKKYLAELTFCYSESTASESAGCQRADLSTPVVGTFPTLVDLVSWSEIVPQFNEPENVNEALSISRSSAEIAFAALALSLIIGVLIL